MIVGHAISRREMRDGDRLHNIYPMAGDAETQKASNSIRLEVHTEMAFQSGSPDALALLCLRASDSPPQTDFCDLRLLWDDLEARQQWLLQEPAFAFHYMGRDGRITFSEPQPIAAPSERGFRFQYDQAIHGVTMAHEEALELLSDKMAESLTELTLTTGDLTLIDNRHIVHGRSPMSPSYDGGDRWLQRCLLSRSGPANWPCY
jgi:L-asparagine oxygenase